MFTGLVKDLGRVTSVTTTDDGQQLTIETDLGTDDFDIGESIAVDGVCLTVTEVDGAEFSVDVSPETLQRTSLGELSEGAKVHLERALRVGDRLGGHFVQGHVDGVGTVRERRRDGDAWRVTIEVPEPMERWLVEKGSIAVDGVSLTVNEIEANRFGVAIIPHTAEATKLASYDPGDRVNIEADMLGKYVDRLTSQDRDATVPNPTDFQESDESNG